MSSSSLIRQQQKYREMESKPVLHMLDLECSDEVREGIRDAPAASKSISEESILLALMLESIVDNGAGNMATIITDESIERALVTGNLLERANFEHISDASIRSALETYKGLEVSTVLNTLGLGVGNDSNIEESQIFSPHNISEQVLVKMNDSPLAKHPENNASIGLLPGLECIRLLPRLSEEEKRMIRKTSESSVGK